MAKQKHTAEDSLLGGVAIIGGVVFMIITAVSNLFSVSTFVDYGPEIWFNNVITFQIDKTYQATKDLPIYAEASIAALDETPLFSIPAGHLFKVRGDIGSEEVDFLAVQAFYGSERKLGFAIVAPVPRDPSSDEGESNPKYIGVLSPSHPDFPMPNSAISYYSPSEKNISVESMLDRKVLIPSKIQDIRDALTLYYANTAFDRERVKDSEEWVTVEELSDDNILAYIPANQKKVYDDIVSRYARGRDMVLYQIDPSFDAVAAIRSGNLPDVPSYGFLTIAALGIILALSAKISSGVAKRRGRIQCAECGHKSHDHDLVQEKSWRHYKHQTKTGKPDGRYKDNPLLTTTSRVYSCQQCGERFRHNYVSN